MPKAKPDWDNTRERIIFSDTEALIKEIKTILCVNDNPFDEIIADLFAADVCVAVEIYMNSKELRTEGQIKAGLKEIADDIESLLTKIVTGHRMFLSVEVAVLAEKDGQEWSLDDTLLKIADIRHICRDYEFTKRYDWKLELSLTIMDMFFTLLREKPTVYDSKEHGSRSIYAKMLSACFRAADHGIEPSDLLRIMSKAKHRYPEWKAIEPLSPERERAASKLTGLSD